jgi:hypothetical protein
MQATPFVFFNHGKVPKVVINSYPQNLFTSKSPFANTDLVWTIQHEGPNKVSTKYAYISGVHVLDFLQGERGDLGILI